MYEQTKANVVADWDERQNTCQQRCKVVYYIMYEQTEANAVADLNRTQSMTMIEG